MSCNFRIRDVHQMRKTVKTRKVVLINFSFSKQMSYLIWYWIFGSFSFHFATTYVCKFCWNIKGKKCPVIPRWIKLLRYMPAIYTTLLVVRMSPGTATHLKIFIEIHSSLQRGQESQSETFVCHSSCQWWFATTGIPTKSRLTNLVSDKNATIMQYLCLHSLG